MNNGRELLVAEKELLAKFADIRDEKLSPRDAFVDACVDIGFAADELAEWEAMDDLEIDELPSGKRTSAKYVRAGLVIADLSHEGKQPVYHDRRHTAEAVASAALLAKAEFANDPAALRMQGIRLLVAMVGHDIFHDGRTNAARKIWMEVISSTATLDVLEAFHLPDAELKLINEIIVGTEFMEMAPENRRAYSEGELGVKTILRALANDADILASVLPITGPTRGRLLSDELKNAGVVGWETPASWKGRLGFLKMVPLISKGAQKLGFTKLQDDEVAVLGKLALGSGTVAPLDSLSFPDARAEVLKELGYQLEMHSSERPVERSPEAVMDEKSKQLRLF